MHSRESSIARDDQCMHELPNHMQTDWSSATVGYASAYQSCYTVVYTKLKEVW